MWNDRRPVEQLSTIERKTSPRHLDKQTFMKQQQQFTDNMRESLKKKCRPSLLIEEDFMEHSPQPVQPRSPVIKSPSQKQSELKDSISTNSTFKDMTIKTKSSSQKYVSCPPKFEDFVIGASLGAGKFGTVHVVRHKKTGFICAMKIISKAKILKQNIVHQLIREIKIQSYCEHPNLTKLYGYFSTTDQVFLLTELSTQGQLFSLIQKHKMHNKPMPQPTIISILKQVCEGVRYMHALKIIHRDIKPQNIVMERGTAKICDFGWAVSHTSNLRSTFCGTPLYVSPEILKGELYDEKVDLWAIGVLAWQMVYGDIPFEINCEQQLTKIITEDIEFPQSPKVSEQFKDFVLCILKKNPKERLRIGGLLEHPFLAE